MNGRDALHELIGAAGSVLRGVEGPVFREPWEAQVFAMVLALHKVGVFSWSEWAAALSRRIVAAQSGDGEADVDYGRWLSENREIPSDRGSLSNMRSPAVDHVRQSAWSRGN
jgi:nitrile hydratase accessory protein